MDLSERENEKSYHGGQMRREFQEEVQTTICQRDIKRHKLKSQWMWYLFQNMFQLNYGNRNLLK